MPDIILATLNARYAHSAFGLRYLMANLGELQSRARLLESDLGHNSLDIAESILIRKPVIVGLGVYIWNAQQSLRLVADLKRIAPQLLIVLGGPEISHETEQQELAALADYVITGEGDLAFGDLCRQLLSGQRPPQKIIAPSPPDLGAIQLPYDLYDENDIAHRVIYVEASRGCPFECDFCLSALDARVRAVPLERFLPAMQKLLDRGARHFKFVDRTFNLNISTSLAILRFFLDRCRPGLFLHCEIIPDRLPAELCQLIRQFPAGALQFEVGIQTFNESVAARISRRQDNAKAEDNLRFLRSQSSVHIHADLIAGLPGEDIDSFAAGFDRLVALGPQEIQLGILKRLRGAPIARHDRQWRMVYSPQPPYEVLSTSEIDFPTMQRIRRFASYWDMICNSGHFLATAPLIWAGGSPFRSFMTLSDWLFAREGRTHAIALPRLARLIFDYLTTQAKRDPKQVAEALSSDGRAVGRRHAPEFPGAAEGAGPPSSGSRGLRRQSRHHAQ